MDTRLTLTIANAGPGEATGVAARVSSPELVVVAVPAEYNVGHADLGRGDPGRGRGRVAGARRAPRRQRPRLRVRAGEASPAPDPDSFPNNGAGPEDDNATLILPAAKADLSLEIESMVPQPVPGIHARFVVTAINDGPANVTERHVRCSRSRRG